MTVVNSLNGSSDLVATGSGRLASVLTAFACVLAIFASLSVHAANAPSYIESMSPFQVRAMTGVLSPTNGNETIHSVTPPEWADDDNVIVPWSGGAKATSGTKLFVHGGGHGDSGNNGMYIFDFAGTTMPTGWTLGKISAASRTLVNQEVYSDGLPSSVHSYDGVCFASHNNSVYRVGGFPPAGTWARGAWQYDVASTNWTRLPDWPTTNIGAMSIICDSATHKIFAKRASTNEAAFFRMDSNSWSSVKFAESVQENQCMAFDTSRSKLITLGPTNTWVGSVDFVNETVSTSSFNPSGDTTPMGYYGKSMVYDPVADVYWIWGGAPGGDFTNIYEMQPVPPYQITAHALTGDPLDKSDDPAKGAFKGTYGRFVFMSDFRSIGLVLKTRGPSYVIKLPAASSNAPRPPSNVLVN